MLQLPADLRFLDKSLDDFRLVLVSIEQHLDCQISPQIGIAAFENRPHPTASNLAIKTVAAVGVTLRHLGRLRSHDRVGSFSHRIAQHDARHMPQRLAEHLQDAVIPIAEHDGLLLGERGS